MKVLFCDIDGVLNSEKYYAENDRSALSFIDVSRLPLLKRIVDETGALIVLSSSWRKSWDKDINKRDECGVYITKTFAEYGLDIFDKTEYSGGIVERSDEIRNWLSDKEVESFAILDDYPFGWGNLEPFTVVTNPLGRGLEEEHIEKVIKLLK